MRLRRLLRDGGKDVAEMQAAFDQVAPRLRTFAPDLHGAIEAYLKDPKDPAEASSKLEGFFANPPEGYYPPERLTKVLERVRAQDVEGVVNLLVRRDHLGPPLGRRWRSSSAGSPGPSQGIGFIVAGSRRGRGLLRQEVRCP